MLRPAIIKTWFSLFAHRKLKAKYNFSLNECIFLSVASIGLASLSRSSPAKLSSGSSFPGETPDVRILRKLNRGRARYHFIIQIECFNLKELNIFLTSSDVLYLTYLFALEY